MGPPELRRCLQLQQMLLEKQGQKQKENPDFSTDG
jgi:hypothetical protein